MMNRRNFISNITLASICFSSTITKAEEPAKTQTLADLKSLELTIQRKILESYERQSKVFQNNQGYSSQDAQKEYFRCLEEIQPELRALGCPNLPQVRTAESISQYLREINQKLGKHQLGISHVLIRFGEKEFAINTRFYSGSLINVDRQKQIFENIGLKNLRPVPVFLVKQSITPDVRQTSNWPLKKDTLTFGQTITSETGEAEQILIFDEAINKRAKNEPEMLLAMQDQTIVNELANAFFWQRVPPRLCYGKISEQLSVRHLSEAFSDYCSYHVCDGELLLNEITRIITSNNQNYLLSKGLTAQAIKEMMIAHQSKTVPDLFESIRTEGAEGFKKLQAAIFRSYSENTWIKAIVQNEFTEDYIINK